MTRFDPKKLRNAFGTFMTGVTVVTTRETSGIPRGFTANSFTSVSLDPALLLICIDKAAESIDVFTNGTGFAVNILSADQIDTSGLFASKRADKYDLVKWKYSNTGNPILDGVCAWFDCKRSQVVDAGDHVILIGEVQSFHHTDQIGLGYARGGYVNLALERTALQAAEGSSDVVVGAIVAHENQILLVDDGEAGMLGLPASGLDESPGSLKKLTALLNRLGVGVSITSVYSVFENESNAGQFIYYRAKAESDDIDGRFWPLDGIPWDRINSEPVRVMLRRYCEEATSQLFGVYFGSDRAGDVTTFNASAGNGHGEH
ncbi:MAG: flavin reductase [Gammaproteobacteria bacterium]|nr:flavin reductase [Gammaproteobacteria bacterium]